MQVSRTYHFNFDHPAEKLWSVVADTARWGEAIGSPKYAVREDLQEDGSVRVTGQIKICGFTISWEEPPVDWIVDRWFEQRRINYRGPVPFSAMTTTARLTDNGEHSSLALELAFESTNFLGTLIAKCMVRGYEKVIREVLANADRLIRAEQPQLFVSSYQPSSTEVQRGKRLAAEIGETPYGHELAPRLVEDIHSSQEIDLWVMRPLAYARRWGVTTQNVIELFLQSVRSGLLESRWDILCPRCRVSKSAVTNLSDLPEGVHCESCNIDFTGDFSRNVELNFSPSPAVRAVEPGFFCRSGPNVTPHIKGQWTVAANNRRQLPLALPPGRYRLRTLEAGGEVDLDWADGAFPEIRIAESRIWLAGIAMQRCMPGFNHELGLDGVSIRIGLHGGSSIAVTLNERLDYYGETVNLTARLEGQGAAGDITLTGALADDPAVENILRDYAVRESNATMKGIDTPVSIRQFTPSSRE